MRRASTVLMVAFAILALAAPGSAAKGQKLTFDDVTLDDGRVIEIEASVKTHQNKDDKINCSYFTDEYEEHLGYYFDFVEPAPADSDAVLTFCVDHFDQRET